MKPLRVRVPSGCRIRIGETVPALRRQRAETQRNLIARDGACSLALGQQHIAEVGVQLREIRIEFDAAAIISYRLRGAAGRPKDVAHVVVERSMSLRRRFGSPFQHRDG